SGCSALSLHDALPILAACRAGAEIALVGAVGADSFAGIALDLLRRDGVDTRLIQVVEQPTGCAAIMVSSEGENTIAVAPGSCFRSEEHTSELQSLTNL